MSTTMAGQEGCVELELSDMCLAMNMAKMAKGGFSRAATEETQYLIKTPHAEVREENMRSDEFPGLNKMKAAIERHPAMICQNHMARCLPCQTGTAKIHRHAGDPKEQVHLHPTDADSRLQSRLQSRRHL